MSALFFSLRPETRVCPSERAARRAMTTMMSEEVEMNYDEKLAYTHSELSEGGRRVNMKFMLNEH